MRATELYAPTLRQVPTDVESASHRLLWRGGFVRPVAPGLFAMLPLGLRALRRLTAIVVDEIEAVGAGEVLLPVLRPASASTTGVLRTCDSQDRWLELTPPAAPGLAALISHDISSYRQLPLTVYQIAHVGSDEARPRAGLARARNNHCLQACTFQVDAAGLEEAHEAMVATFRRALGRLSLDVVAVDAGRDATEFLAPTADGPDSVLRCRSCGYAATADTARSRSVALPASEGGRPSPILVETPAASTTAAVCEMLNREPADLLKTLIYRADEGFVAALVRGDRQLSEAKLRAVLDAAGLRMATAEEIREVTGGAVGFSGPVGLPDGVRVVADAEVEQMADAVVGANRADAHLVHVVPGRDFVPAAYHDLRAAAAGEPCAGCQNGMLEIVAGIVVATARRLSGAGTAAWNPACTGEDGSSQAVRMGTYELGLSRCLAALVEQHHDEAGVIWPVAVAPFEVAVLLLDPGVPELRTVAIGLYEQLAAAGRTPLLDDRDERPGAKFKDADLVGYPVVVVVGKRLLAEGLVEVRRRCDRLEKLVPPERVGDTVAEFLQDA